MPETIGRLTRFEKNKLTDEERLISIYRKDLPLALNDLLNIEPNWIQIEMLNEFPNAAFVLELLGRGCGKTSTTVYYLTLMAMLYPNMKIGCLAPSFRQANYVFDEMRAEIEPKSPFFRASMDKGGISISTMRGIARFKNGSFIEALPIGDVGATIRGRRYNIIFIDEFADMPETVVRQVIQPFLNVVKRGMKNQMIIGSTARYKWNHLWPRYVFYRAKEGTWPKEVMDRLTGAGFKVEPNMYKVFEYYFLDVNAQENGPFQISDYILEEQYNQQTQDEFGMENLNLFPDETVGFFSSQLVLDKAVSIEEDEQILLLADDKDSFFAFGVDVARSDDPRAANFCVQIIRIKNLQKNLCKTITLHGASFQEMLACIRHAHIDFGTDRVLRIDIDAGGGGTTLRDLLSETWKDTESGRTFDPIIDMDDENFNVTPTQYGVLHMQNQTDVFNNHMFHSLKADLEQRRLVLPVTIRKSYDKPLEKVGIEIGKTKTELIMLEAKAIRAGLKFDVPKGYQKDRAVALALANNGINILFGEGRERQPDYEPAIGFWV